MARSRGNDTATTRFRLAGMLTSMMVSAGRPRPCRCRRPHLGIRADPAVDPHDQEVLVAGLGAGVTDIAGVRVQGGDRVEQFVLGGLPLPGGTGERQRAHRDERGGRTTGEQGRAAPTCRLPVRGVPVAGTGCDRAANGRRERSQRLEVGDLVGYGAGRKSPAGRARQEGPGREGTVRSSAGGVTSTLRRFLGLMP